MLAGTALAAVNLVEETAYLEDASGTLTFEQVVGHGFKPYTGVLNQGYSPSVFWVRLKMSTDRLKDRDTVVFKIMPAYLDRIDLFHRGHEPKKPVGDRYPQANNGSAALAFNFFDKLDQSDPYYWIRLETSSTHLMSVEAFSLTDFHEENAKDYVLSGLLLGILLAFSLLGCTYFYAEQEVVNGAFVLKQLASVLMTFAYLGYQRMLFSGAENPAFMDHSTSVLILMQMLATLFFYKVFFQEYSPKMWVIRGFNVSLAMVAISLLMFMSGHVRMAMHLNMANILWAAVFLFLVPLMGIDWSLLVRPIISRKILVLSQSVNFLVLLYTSLPSLGLVDGSRFSAYAILLHALVSNFIMLLMVRQRAVRLDQDRVSEIALQMNKAEHEKNQRERQEQFMAMLTHELKTPLALIRFAVRHALGAGKSSARIEQAVDDINAVIDRCQQVDKLDKGWAFARAEHALDSLVANSLDKLVEYHRVRVSAIPAVVLHTDAALFSICLGNLLENALKYSPRDAVIDLDIRMVEDGTAVTLAVKNKVGKAGIPDASQVFKKYYRSEYARTTTGSGLGLYIVQALIQLLDGNITCTCEKDQVIFELCLPLSKS